MIRMTVAASGVGVANRSVLYATGKAPLDLLAMRWPIVVT
jgi:hypothetical protein